MRHAMDPDHVVAITTIVTKQQGIAKAGVIGALWGLGHTFTIFVVGTIIILFQVTIPPRIGLSMEFAVAAMLILLGVSEFDGDPVLAAGKIHAERTSASAASIFNDSSADTQFCDSDLPTKLESVEPKLWLDRMLQTVGLYNVLRPLAIGIVHGLAGSAAVALLVMTTIRDPWWGITYLFLFGVGTIAGMMIITAVIAMPFAFTVRRFSGWSRGMAVASGLLESWIRSVPFLPDWFCGWSFLLTPAVDPAMTVKLSVPMSGDRHSLLGRSLPRNGIEEVRFGQKWLAFSSPRTPFLDSLQMAYHPGVIARWLVSKWRVSPFYGSRFAGTCEAIPGL